MVALIEAPEFIVNLFAKLGADDVNNRVVDVRLDMSVVHDTLDKWVAVAMYSRDSVDGHVAASTGGRV